MLCRTQTGDRGKVLVYFLNGREVNFTNPRFLFLMVCFLFINLMNSSLQILDTVCYTSS